MTPTEKKRCIKMLVLWARWAAGVDDDSSVLDFVRERGKAIAEGIKDDEAADDGQQY